MIDRQSLALIAVACLLALGIGWWILKPAPAPMSAQQADGPLVDVKLPENLSAIALDGKILFDRTCADCHGENAAGSSNGPPLIHKIYEPSHHGDQSFLLAARNGVRAHHWKFGNMPAQPDVREVEIEAIVVYVRELQRANGIF